MAEFTCGTGLWGNAPKPGDPDNVLGISATPAFGGINVEWSYPTTNPQGVAHFELYRSLNESFDTAVRHQIVNGTFFYDRIENDTTTVYYYWIRSVSVNGTVAEPIGPASASARPLIADLIEQITGRIDNGVLALSLQSEIARINVVQELLNTEVGNRLLAISSLQDTFSALEQDTLGTLSDFNDTINGLLDADTLFVDELNNISTSLGEADDRITTVRAELAAEDLRLDQKADAIESALNAAQQALELKDQELTDALEQNVNDFTSLKEVYETESSVTANSITGILARVEDNEAAVGNLTRLQVENDLIEAIQFDYIKAESANRVAAFRTQEMVRVTEEEALAQRIDEQVARVDDNVAEISSLSTTLSNTSSALASRISELSAKLDATPTFASGWELGADYDQWIAATSSNVLSPETSSVYSGAQAGALTSAQASASADGNTQGLYALIPEGATTAFKGNGVVVRLWAKQIPGNASAQFAVAYSTAGVGNSGWQYFTPTDQWSQFEFTYDVPDGGAVNHRIGIWADTSGSGKGILVDGLTVTQSAGELSDVTAAIEEQQQALVDLEQAIASDFQSIESRLDGAEADIQTESSTRSTAIDALAQTVESLESDLGSAQSSLTNLQQTQATQNSAIVSRASSLETRMGNAESNISSIEESTSTLEESIATATSQLQSQIDDNKSSITTEASTRSTAIDNTVSLITALRGEYEGTAGLVANHSTLIQNNQDTIAQNVTAVQAARDDAEALVAAEETARINAISAQASRTDGVITRMGAAESNISSLTSGLSDAEQALSTYQSTVSSEFDDVRGTLNSQVTSLSNADEALVERIDGLTATVGDLELGNTAGVLQEAAVRVSEDELLASMSDQLAVRLGAAEAAIVAERRVTAEKEYIEAIQFNAIEVTKAGATAGMQTEIQIRVEEGEAFAQQLNTIGAEVEENMATILEDYETKADAESARATLGNAVYARIDAADAAIVSEKTTRTTQFNNLNADIAAEAGIRAGAISGVRGDLDDEVGVLTDAIASVSNQVDLVSAQAADGVAALKSELQAQVVGQSMVADGSFLNGDGEFWGNPKYLTYRQKNENASDSLYSDAPAANFAVFGANMNYGSTMHCTNVFFYVTPGEEYSCSYWFANAGGGDGELRYSIQWYDSDNSELVQWRTHHTHDMSNYSSREWHFSGSAVATVPAGAAKGRVIITYGNDATQGNPCFTAVRCGLVNSALAERIDSVQTSVGDDLAAFEQTITTEINTTNGKLDSIGALYTAKVQTNGLIGGFGIFNDGTEVQAGFDVDTFWVGRTNSNKVKPFIVIGDEVFINEAVINKLTFSKLTDESGSFIVRDGKVKADYIEADQLEVQWSKLQNVNIEWGDIRNVSIGNADIENAAITSAKIKNAAIDSLQLAGNAVTVPVASYTSSTKSWGNDESWKDIQSVTIDPEGAPVDITAAFRFLGQAQRLTTGGTVRTDIQLDARILREGSTIITYTNIDSDSGSATSDGDSTAYAGVGVGGMFALPFIDTNTSGGARTYTVQLRVTHDDIWTNNVSMKVSQRYLKAVGLKR